MMNVRPELGASCRLLEKRAVRATLVVVLLAAAFAFTRQGRVAVKTALFLPQILPSAPLRPMEWLTSQPLHARVSYPLGSGQGAADLYRPPSGGRRGAVVLFLGVAPAGPDDPRVVGLGEALARAGMVVMIPWSERMMAWRIDPEAPEHLVAAFQYLRQQEFVDPGRAGLGGFCVGASLAVVAAADPRINDQVAFVNAFGGYYDLRDLLAAMASGTRFYNGSQEPWTPGPLASEIFPRQIIEMLPDPDEQALLQRAFLEGGQAAPDELQGLSSLGWTAYRLLEDVTLEEAQGLIAELPREIAEALAALSPSQVIGQVHAPVLIMHDRQDDAVPSEESRRLADALHEGGQAQVHLTEFTLFQHVEPIRHVGLLTYVREIAKLYRHMYRILLAAT